MTSPRRRFFVPCVLLWICLAWIATIGLRLPLDPTPSVWAHASGQLQVALAGGVLLVWPGTVLHRSSSRWQIFGESMLLALLLGGATIGLSASTGKEPGQASLEALVLFAWTLCIGGWLALAQRRGWWIGWAFSALALVALPASILLPAAWRGLAGPLAAGWMITDQPILPALNLLLGTTLALGLFAVSWSLSCLRGKEPGECRS